MITIPKPCHEDWNQMSQQEKGRLCDKCCKVVVDFTNKTIDEIKGFLSANSDQKVCGRLKTEHVTVPAARNLQTATRNNFISRSRIFVAALYFVFGGLLFASCNSRSHPEVMGKMEARFTAPSEDTAKRIPNTGKNKKKEECVKPEPNYEIMGDVAYYPEDTVKVQQPK